MKITDIPKNLHVKRPVRNSKSRGLKVFGAGRKLIKIFRPIRPGAKCGYGGHTKCQRGKGFGMLAASIAIPILTSIINKL